MWITFHHICSIDHYICGMTTSAAIFKWLDQNKDLIRISGICKAVEIDKANFSKCRPDGIPEKYLIPIMNVISPLGFNLDELVAQNNKPQIKKRILTERNPPKKPSPKIKDLTKPTGVIKAPEQPKTNYSINTTNKKEMPVGLSKTEMAKWRRDNL